MNQKKNREENLKEWLIEPIKWVFSRTQTKELLSSKLYQNLQRSLSNPDNFFLLDKSKLKSNNPSYNREIFNTLTDCIVVEKDQIPKNFIKLFDLDIDSENLAQDVKDIFKRARFLKYMNSHRIIMIDDKIIVFKNEEKLVHKKEIPKLTQWEKRRTEIFTTFNTFSNIYDAIRSQYHILDSNEENQNDYELIHQSIISLIEDIKDHFENIIGGESLQEQLNNIIKNIGKSKNSQVLSAKLNNLEQISFNNRSITTNSLQWAKNKFENRFNDTRAIIWIVTKHFLKLKDMLHEYEWVLDYFIRQNKFASKDLSLNNYNRSYCDVHQKYWDIAPFSVFHSWIDKYKNDPKLFPIFIHFIESFFEAYKSEHENKINKTEIDPETLKLIKSMKCDLKDMEDVIKLK